MTSTGSSGRRYVRPTRVTIILLALGVLAVLIWFADEAPARIAITLGVLTAIVADALIARATLRDVVLDLRPEGTAVAGEPTRWRVTVAP